MIVRKTINLNIGDTIDVLTSDGWEHGIIEDFIDNKFKIYVASLNKLGLYTINDIKI